MRACRRLRPRPDGRTGTAPSLDGLLAAVRTHHPGSDTAPVERAYAEAAFWHEGQWRRSGGAHVTHCLAVAVIVADLRLPPHVVCAALLHDVLDGTACPPQRIADRFGPEVADLIAAVRTAEVSRYRYRYRQGGKAMMPASDVANPSRETAVLAVRLADRLHNMRTITFLARARQLLKARETLDVFVPVASAAGLDTVGRELRDLASAVLRPAPSSYAVTGRLLTACTLLLPSRQRARWLEEWSADLAVHDTRRARTCFTLRVLLGAPRLSLMLRRPLHRERR